MEERDKGSRTGRKTPLRLWQLDCAALTTLLGVCFSPGQLRERLVEHAAASCAEREDDEVWIYWALHQFCHRENALSSSLDDELNRRYSGPVRWVRRAPYESIVETVRSDKAFGEGLPPVLWGLLTDPDPRKRCLGNYLVHAYLQRGMNLFRLRPVPAQAAEDRGSSDRRIEALAREAESLRDTVRRKDEAIDRMLEYISRTRRRTHEEMAHAPAAPSGDCATPAPPATTATAGPPA